MEILCKDSPWLRATKMVPSVVRLLGLVTLWGRQGMWQDVQAGAHCQEHPSSRTQLGMTVGPQAGTGGRKMVLVKVLSWLPTQGSAMGSSCSLGKGFRSCTAPRQHPCCQDRPWSSEHPFIPAGGSGHLSLPTTCVSAQP